jgi:ABC-type molybdate transport system substrate-binding protein
MMEESMKRSILIQVAALLVLCVTGSAVLAYSSHTFTGKIVSVDPKMQTVVVKGNSGEKTFHIEKATSINVGGNTKIDQLQAGQDVSVSYSVSGSKHIAKSIKAMTPATK